MVDELIKNKDQFDKYLYTDWRTATEELRSRESNQRLTTYINQSLPDGMPLVMAGRKTIALFRHVATPNFEAHRFMMCADVLDHLEPIYFELTKDKFVDVNPLKRTLGKMPFFKMLNKKQEPVVEYKTIIDMSRWNGKPLSEIQTISGESFVDFHRSLFLKRFPSMKYNFYDLSDWLENLHGKIDAKLWYKKFLTLFLKDSILFENFLTIGRDAELTRDVVLPAIIEIEKESGYKPLIVALEPTHIEGDDFWNSYPYALKQHV